MITPNSRYVAWLQRHEVPLYKSHDAYWQVYKRALIPVSIAPCFVTLSNDEVNTLLRESGAWFLRYSSDPANEETPWWYVICDSYDPKRISAKIRQNINRGSRSCSTRRIQAEWLAENGYGCYQAAYSRYRNASAVSEERFRESVLAQVGGPFEFWGVFVGENLAGYCQCIVDGNSVNTSVTKYDPGYLKLRSAYSLVSSMINHYAVENGMVISNGNRALVHDTQYQEFLIKLGFRRQFCRLNVVYRPWLRSAVRAAFPFHGLFEKVPDAGFVHNLKAIFSQEELRRLCLER